MTPERLRQIEALYHEARSRPEGQRTTFLAAACGDDDELRGEVESLLAQPVSMFLERPVAAAVNLSQFSIGAQALVAGRRIGNYTIRARIGSGGMGEVYRASDTTLHRDVALKVLPAEFASAPDRLARLTREAQILAALNHPHIGHIYGLEQSDGVSALVLELIEGPTLADRLAHGRLPVDESVRIAAQIADALAAAHAQGIIHRDLKPANIKVRPDGTVKVLDFGLAKVAVAASTDFSPTLPVERTQAGMVLGTAAYMSPEQARGQAVDARTDIWAFGCILYEMLTGRGAFGGDTVSDIIAAVLERDPDWTVLPAVTPPSVRRLLQRCLQRTLARRLADIRDAQLDLEDATSSPDATVDRAARASRVGRVALGLLVATLVVVVGAAAMYFRREPVDGRVYRSTILAAASNDANAAGMLALSSDGRRLAFIGSDANGNNIVYVRSLDSLASQPLVGTEGAQTVFWSPDGHFLAFIAQNKLKKIDAAGTRPAIELCDALVPLPGTWNTDDAILFTPRAGSPLFRISSSGGTPAAVTSLDAKAGETAHVYPFFLPDQRHFLYLAQASGGVPHGIYAASLDSTERTRLLDRGSNAQYAQGVLVFLRGTTLMAQPFDVRRMALGGAAAALADQLLVSESSSFLRTGWFSVSETGALVYRADISGGSDLAWVDRAGRRLAKLGNRAKYLDPTISPDGTRASVSVMEAGTATRDLWIFDMSRGLRNRLTFDPEDDVDARWAPDGSRVAFASRRKGHLDLYVKTASGADDEQLLWADDLDKYPQSWSPDGRFLLYVTVGSTAGQDLWVLPLVGEQRKPFRLFKTQASVGAGQLSPDGRWVAYRSNDTGHFEIYVARFPGPGGRWQISTDGGNAPRWSRDGKELFYIGPGNMLMAAAVKLEETRVEKGPVTKLFQVRGVTPRYFYDVSPDGERFLVNTADESAGSTALTLVLNWPALLKTYGASGR